MGRPVGVRVGRPDGTEIPCELVHLGVDKEGMDLWEVGGIEYHPERGDHLLVDVLPARTAFVISGGTR